MNNKVRVLDDNFYINHFLKLDQVIFTKDPLSYLKDSQLLAWRQEYENINDDTLLEKQLIDKYSAIWLWYHHAAQVAYTLGKRLDAKEYIISALRAKVKSGNPNKITQLFVFLYDDDINGARTYVNGLDVNERDKDTAVKLLEDFINDSK